MKTGRQRTVEQIIDIYRQIRIEKIEDEISFTAVEVWNLVSEIWKLREENIEENIGLIILRAENEKLKDDIRSMIDKAVENNLDGYRELATKVCNAEKERDDLIVINRELMEACLAAKKYLEPELVESGRTVFWKLVAAIERAKENV